MEPTVEHLLFGLTVAEWGALLGFLSAFIISVFAAYEKLKNIQANKALDKANDLHDQDNIKPESIATLLPLLGKKGDKK